MEETRRSFLTYQILSGSKYLTINDKRYRLINPSKELRILAEHVYQETMDDLKFDSLITKEKCDLLLRGLNIWQPSDDEALKRLEKHLDDKKVDLFNALYNSERQITIRKAIATAKKGIEKAHARKHSLDYMPLHYHASITKRRFLVALCLQDETNKHVYNEGSFKTADSTLVEQAIVLLDQDTISIEEYRELARHDPWRTIWNIGKESCIGMPPSEWTDEQKMLVTFAKMYENTYQNPDCPSEEVFEDDDMFDGWLIAQKRKREQEQKTKQVDNLKGIKDGAQEVFVYAPNREDANKIYNLNDVNGRQKIQQRERFIEHHGSVSAIDLPDTKLEVRQQAIQEYKDKFRKG